MFLWLSEITGFWFDLIFMEAHNFSYTMTYMLTHFVMGHVSEVGNAMVFVSLSSFQLGYIREGARQSPARLLD